MKRVSRGAGGQNEEGKQRSGGRMKRVRRGAGGQNEEGKQESWRAEQ